MKISATKIWFDDDKLFVELNDKQISECTTYVVARTKKRNSSAII